MPRIVVLEDDPACLSVFQAVLARAGYEVMAASHCAEVQRHVDSSEPDAIIVDIFLRTQWCHGTAIALRSQRAHPAVKILFVSGTGFGDWDYADQRDVARLAPDSWDVLHKPFPPAALAARLGALLDRRSAPPKGSPGCPANRYCASLNPPGTGAPLP